MISFEDLERTRLRAGHSQREVARRIGRHWMLWQYWKTYGFNPTRETMERIEEYMKEAKKR